MLFIDRAAQHRSSIMIRKHLEENKDVIRVEYLPKGSPDYNAVENATRKIFVSKYYLNPQLKCYSQLHKQNFKLKPNIVRI